MMGSRRRGFCWEGSREGVEEKKVLLGGVT